MKRALSNGENKVLQAPQHDVVGYGKDDLAVAAAVRALALEHGRAAIAFGDDRLAQRLAPIGDHVDHLPLAAHAERVFDGRGGHENLNERHDDHIKGNGRHRSEEHHRVEAEIKPPDADVPALVQDNTDEIQAAAGRVDGIVLNPGGYAHTSVAILDALRLCGVPAVEVLLTAPDEREPFRKTDVVSFGCQGHFIGQGPQGYLHACAYLAQLLRLDGTPQAHIVM